MFAFALWDSNAMTLMLVRDRLGIKPLYYIHLENELYFASEIKSLATACPRLTFDRKNFWRFLRLATSQGVNSVFEEVKRVEPATILTFSREGLATGCYWNLLGQFCSPMTNDLHEEDAVRQFDSLMSESVRYHLVSDVPVGAFLSGGLDSSTVAAYMRQLEPERDMHTYSVTFSGYAEHNEQEFARKASEHLHTAHTEVDFPTSLSRDFAELAWACDEPFGILASYALFQLAKVAAGSTKVVMTGDGADELLAGYQGYLLPPTSFHEPMRSFLRAGGNAGRLFVNALPRKLRGGQSLWLKALRKCGSPGLGFSENTTYSSALDYLVLNGSYVAEAWKAWTQNQAARDYDALSGGSDLRRKLYSSLKSRLVDEMLTKVDRMTMAHGLEARVPFLDHLLVEFAIALPDNMKLNRTQTPSMQGKYILKRVAERRLPRSIVYREKHGFDIPLQEWMRQIGDRTIVDLLLNGVLVREKIVEEKALHKMLLDGERQSFPASQLVANLLIFEEWYRVYASRVPGFSLSF
jgi:asparagine synthase (glutamine-hydrolysing)